MLGIGEEFGVVGVEMWLIVIGMRLERKVGFRLCWVLNVLLKMRRELGTCLLFF